VTKPGGSASIWGFDIDQHPRNAKAIGEARAGDVVVIAGRGAEQYQDVAGQKLPFDDREVAREELRRLRAPA